MAISQRLIASEACAHACGHHSGRRAVLALAPLLASAMLPAMPAAAANRPFVEVLNTPEVCQGRCKKQDFVVVQYVARRSDTGEIFDDRYAQRPLIFELGSFYLPGVDAGLESACVGSRLKFSWPSSPSLGTEFEQLLPAGKPIEIDMQLISIRYALFGEKMRNAESTYRFTPYPLTLTSTADHERGHAARTDVVITKDNPFSIAAGETNLITSPTSVLGPLFGDAFKLPKLPQLTMPPE